MFWSRIDVYMARLKGFTLIEAIITLGIIGILFFASIPIAWNTLQLLELKNTAASIVSDLRFAQGRALALRSTVNMEFYPKALLNDRAYYLINRVNIVNGKKEQIKKANIPPEFNFSSSRTIKFSYSGFPPAGGSGTVVLFDRGGRSKSIIISSAGRVRVE